jgi:hypothetical protein
MRRAVSLLMVALWLVACASERAAGPPPETPEFVDGVRQKPVTIKEVEHQVSQRRGKLAGCYRTERLNSPSPARFLIELAIPNDGGEVPVSLLTSEPAGQPILETCVLQALANLRFPPHIGEPFRLRVPIEPMDSF